MLDSHRYTKIDRRSNMVFNECAAGKGGLRRTCGGLAAGVGMNVPWGIARDSAA